MNTKVTGWIHSKAQARGRFVELCTFLGNFLCDKICKNEVERKLHISEQLAPVDSFTYPSVTLSLIFKNLQLQS